MTYFIWLLRIVHIVGGVFWAGGVFMMAFFIGPAVAATGDAGQKFVGYLVGQLKLSTRLSAAAGSTVLAGAILYWIDSDGLSSAWTRSGAGTGFTIGALFGLAAFVLGILAGRAIRELGKLGAQTQGKPAPKQMAQIGALQQRQTMLTKYTAYTLIASIIFMSVARYFIF